MKQSWWIAGLIGLLGLGATGCGAGTEGGEQDVEHPSWLVGNYATPGERQGDSDHSFATDVTLELHPDGTYAYKQSCSSSCPSLEGNWRLSGMHLQFTGFLDDVDLDLTTSMSPNCRILRQVHGEKLWRNSMVQDCPAPARALTEAECKRVGRYRKSSHSESTTLAHSFYDEFTLDADHFAMNRYSTTRFECSHNYAICVDSFDDSAPMVGEWKVTDEGVQIIGSVVKDLDSYTFTPAPAPDGCPTTH